MSRAPVLAYSGVFGVGVLAGLAALLGDTDTTSTGASVAVANAVHVGIALVLLLTGVVVHRRDRGRLRRLARWPVTDTGWRAVLRATVAAPVALAEVVPAMRTGARRRPLPAGLALTALALLAWYAPLRAGMQVFAGLDRDVVRDAWGGPTFVGAALAHGMDLAILCGGALFLIHRLTYARWPDRRSGAGAVDGRS